MVVQVGEMLDMREVPVQIRRFLIWLRMVVAVVGREVLLEKTGVLAEVREIRHGGFLLVLELLVKDTMGVWVLVLLCLMDKVVVAGQEL